MRQPYPDGLATPQRYGAIVAIGLGIMLSVLDGTIVNVALPTVTRELQTTEAHSIWAVNAFQLAVLISLLPLSSLGDRLGYHRIYLTGIVGFIFTSLLCGFAPSLGSLVAARTLQGVSAAAVMSVNTALVRQIYPKAKLGRGMAINSLVVALSAAAGPSIAAAVLSVASWHWLFWINVPVGLAAAILSFKFLPRRTPQKPEHAYDYLGAVFNALTFGLFFLAVSGLAHQLSSGLIVGAVVGCGLIGTLFVRQQQGSSVPLLPLDLLRIPIFRLSIITSMSSFTAQMLVMISLPFYLQGVLQRGVVETGLLLTPWPIAVMIVAPIAGRLVGKVHAGILGALGLALFALGLGLLAVLGEQVSNADFAWRVALCGAGFALFQSPNNYTLISSAPANRSGGASGMLGTARLTGQTLGASLVALLFTWYPANAGQLAISVACGLAMLGAVLSALRIRQRIPS
ncbi:MFS transporter [Thiopseudomonas alkaliphila]|uniref:MFS transporter n=1 Tax=Thiopseudomonas alkaliphila TaxID=1697053 RepID=UPI00069EB748|nr:MFS transporter [Thiopseudomonas alkaliphila]AKX52444.1 multidrug MFS transporter [Thiopseudomonas alkaliphila]